MNKTTDISASVWVSASAGTGKTKNLIDRILALLVHSVQPSKILCLTYTKNAASEMLSRLNSYIKKWHSMDDDTIKLDLKKLGIDCNLYHTAKSLLKKSEDNQWVKIQTIHSFCKTIIDKFPIESNIMPNINICDDKLKNKLIHDAYLGVINDPEYSNHISSLIFYCSDIFKVFQENISCIRKFFLKYNADTIEQIQSIFYEFFDNEELLRDLNISFFYISLGILKNYQKLKNNIHTMDYDDIILIALDLLKNNSFILQKMDEQIEHILVDEAQDTSTDQWEIIKIFADELFSHYKTDKTLFIVGDYKQSIYSFQGADLSLFDKMRDYFKSSCIGCGQTWHDIKLHTSYRSSPVVIDFVNHVFNRVFPEDVHKTIRNQSLGNVIINPLFEQEKDQSPQFEDNSKLINLEKTAEHIAQYISNLIESRAILPSKNRPAQPGDFMILFQKRSELAKFITKALNKLNVNCSGSDRLNLTDELIIEDLLCLAKFSVFPYDDLNFAKLLRSPIIDISENELFELCTNRGEDNLWNHFMKQNNGNLQKLQNYISMNKKNPHVFFMQTVINNDANTLINRIGGNSSEAFTAFLEICEEYQSKEIGSLRSFINWISEEEIIIKKSKILNDNSVKILTAHGSKGLQSPVVIIADSCTYKGKSNNIIQSDNDFAFFTISNLKSEKVDFFKEHSQKKEAIESMRLLYVAITRAEDSLSIYGMSGLKDIHENSWYNFIKKSFNNDSYDKVQKFFGSHFELINIDQSIGNDNSM